MNIYVILLILLGVVGLSSMARNSYGEETFTQRHFDAGKITDVYAKDINNHVEIVSSNEDTVSITYFDSEKEHYNISVSGGRLSVAYEEKRPWYMYLFNWNMKTYTLTLHVPESMLTTLNAATTNGNLTFSGVQAAGSIQGKCTNGKITLNRIAAERINISSTNGKVELTNINTHSDATFTSTNGAVTATNITADSLDLHTTNGKITTARVNVKTKLDISSTNGAIAGSIIGQAADFTISAHTTNGKNNLKNLAGGGAKALNLRTTNGKIDITFE